VLLLECYTLGRVLFCYSLLVTVPQFIATIYRLFLPFKAVSLAALFSAFAMSRVQQRLKKKSEERARPLSPASQQWMQEIRSEL